MCVRIVRISDEPIDEWLEELVLPQGQVGEIAVCGPVVTREYLTQVRANCLAKIKADGGFWHRMGDVGYIDERGRLWFCGRKAERVTTENGTLFTDPCEGIFNAHSRVRRSALVGVGSSPRQRPVLCVELAPGDADRGMAELTNELLARAAANPATKAIKTILYHPGFPVDIRHNAKIFREKLAVWAARQLA